MTETQKVFDEVVKCSGPVSLRQWAGLLQGAAVIIPANSTVTVDIGSRALTTGFLDLICESDSQRLPTVIQILCSECYESPMGDSKGRVKGDRSDHENGQLYGTADFYTLHDGMNCYSPFWFRTFRYIRLTFNAGDAPVSLQSLSYRETHYPLDVKSSITMGGPFLTKLWDISLNTLRNCMHETYEDCPFYEQQQFAMDTRSQILFTYLVSRDDRLARKAIHEFHASQRDDGLLETNFPVAGRCITIPSFSLFWVLMVYDHMVHFGDEKLTKTYVGSVDSVLNYFDQHINKLGLVSGFESDCWPFVDWIDAWFTPEKGFMGLAVPKPYYSHGAATFHSLVYAYTLSKASDLCTFLGRRDTAAEYTARQQAIVHAICTHCYDATNAVFLDGPGAADQLSQHTQIFAVLSGCAQGTAAKDLMRRTILEPGSMERVSFAMSFYAFRAVSAAGIYEECWGELIKPWGKMIENNLTTWAESESMARSDCHGWSATPLFEIATEILGVEYRSEAYTSRLGLGDEPIRVAPKPSLVDEIRGKVCTKGTSDSGSDEFVVIEWRNGEEPRVLNTVEGKRDLL